MPYPIDSTVQAHIEKDLKSRAVNVLPRQADDGTMSFVYDLSRNAVLEDPLWLYESASCAGSAGFGVKMLDSNDTEGMYNSGRQHTRAMVISAGITYTQAGATADSGKAFTVEMRLLNPKTTPNQVIHLDIEEFSVSANVLHYYAKIYDLIVLKDLYLFVQFERRIGTWPANTIYSTGVSGVLRPSGSF